MNSLKQFASLFPFVYRDKKMRLSETHRTATATHAKKKKCARHATRFLANKGANIIAKLHLNSRSIRLSVVGNQQREYEGNARQRASSSTFKVANLNIRTFK